jgi:drug/metabolite transporter (DMT)-like permease
LTSTSRHRLALGVALVLIVVWGTAFTVQKQVFQAMTVSGFLFARYLFLPVCAALLLCSRHGLRWPWPGAKDRRALVLAALLGQVLHVSLVTFGIDRSTAFSSALILACGPIFTLLVLRVTGHERWGARQLLGVLLAVAGVLIFLSEKWLRADWSGTSGDAMLLGGAALFSIYSVQTKSLFERMGSMDAMCFTTLLASPVTVLLNICAWGQVNWSALTTTVWLGFVWISLGVAFLGWMLWGWASVVRGVARTAPLMYLMPPVAGLFAWVFSGEVFGFSKLAGAGLALAGVAITQRLGRPR